MSHQSSDVAGNRSPRGARQNEKAPNKDEGLTAELDLLFPKNHVLSNNVNSSASLEKLKNSGNDGKNISKGSKRVNSIMLQKRRSTRACVSKHSLAYPIFKRFS